VFGKQPPIFMKHAASSLSYLIMSVEIRFEVLKEVVIFGERLMSVFVKLSA
jgi:hypothetical protein